MWRYILKRTLMAIPVLLGATFLVFAIMYVAPGDAARIMLGNDASEKAVEALREQMGLNDPFLVQYAHFVMNLL